MAYMDDSTVQLVCGFVRGNVVDERYASSDGCRPTSYRDGRIMSFRREGREERNFYRFGNEFQTRANMKGIKSGYDASIREERIAEDETRGLCETTYVNGVLVSVNYDGRTYERRGKRFVRIEYPMYRYLGPTDQIENPRLRHEQI